MAAASRKPDGDRFFAIMRRTEREIFVPIMSGRVVHQPAAVIAKPL